MASQFILLIFQNFRCSQLPEQFWCLFSNLRSVYRNRDNLKIVKKSLVWAHLNIFHEINLPALIKIHVFTLKSVKLVSKYIYIYIICTSYRRLFFALAQFFFFFFLSFLIVRLIPFKNLFFFHSISIKFRWERMITNRNYNI